MEILKNISSIIKLSDNFIDFFKNFSFEELKINETVNIISNSDNTTQKKFLYESISVFFKYPSFGIYKNFFKNDVVFDLVNQIEKENDKNCLYAILNCIFSFIKNINEYSASSEEKNEILNKIKTQFLRGVTRISNILDEEGKKKIEEIKTEIEKNLRSPDGEDIEMEDKVVKQEKFDSFSNEIEMADEREEEE